ncbi:hypothetical protein Tco_0414873 [Tanacetum coccineum]
MPSTQHQITPSPPQQSYEPLVVPQQSPTSSTQPDSGFVAPSFLPTDDLIASLNKAMMFLNGRVTVQNVQGRKSQGYGVNTRKGKAIGTGFINTVRDVKANQPRVIRCYNCKGEVIMEYLTNISKRRAFWSLNADILKINDFDYQYAISIKEDTVYPCLHSPKTMKETSSIRRIQRRPIIRIEDIVCEDFGKYQAWSLLQETPTTPYLIPWIRLRMTKVIKGEFDKLEDLKVEDVSLTCVTSLEVFNNEFNRLSRMDDDLFTYEVEVANIPYDSNMDDDSEHEADDDMGYDPSNGNNVVGALMNVPIFVGTFSMMTDFAVLKDMDGYRDEGMGNVIFGEPFLREVGIKARRFDGMITIYNGNDEVTYQMVRSHPWFKRHTNEQCNKIPPLLKVSEEDKKNGISHPYQKLKGFYKRVLNLGPDYIRDEKMEESLTHGHISVHEMKW